MVVTLQKSIKPKKLKVDKTRLRILNELRNQGNLVKKDLERPIKTWNDPPKIEVLIDLDKKDATVLIGPTGTDLQVNKFVWGDKGTRPHVIKAKNAPLLKFKTQFTPKTTPGTLASRAGSSSPPWASKKVVNHPGTKARGWSELALRRRKKKFINAMIIAARVES